MSLIFWGQPAVVSAHFPLTFQLLSCTYQTSPTHQPSNERLLKIPKRNVKSAGDRSSSFIAPTVWNSLPASLRSLPTLSDFKTQLRTFLFQQAFPQI